MILNKDLGSTISTEQIVIINKNLNSNPIFKTINLSRYGSHPVSNTTRFTSLLSHKKLSLKKSTNTALSSAKSTRLTPAKRYSKIKELSSKMKPQKQIKLAISTIRTEKKVFSTGSSEL